MSYLVRPEIIPSRHIPYSTRNTSVRWVAMISCARHDDKASRTGNRTDHISYSCPCQRQDEREENTTLIMTLHQIMYQVSHVCTSSASLPSISTVHPSARRDTDTDTHCLSFGSNRDPKSPDRKVIRVLFGAAPAGKKRLSHARGNKYMLGVKDWMVKLPRKIRQVS